MRVSIITCTFNSEKTISFALESCANQTYKDVEHIIIDAESEDNTITIVSKYKHVSKVISEKDGGIYDALNKGIRMSTGDIVGILHSDDMFVNVGVISDIVEVFGHYDVDVVYGDIVFVSRDDTNRVKRRWKAGSYNRDNFRYGWMPPHPTFFTKRELFDRWGFYNDSLKISADYELMLRFMYLHGAKSFYLQKTLVKMRLGGKSTRSIHNRIVANIEDRKAWKYNGFKSPFFTLWLKPLRKILQFTWLQS